MNFGGIAIKILISSRRKSALVNALLFATNKIAAFYNILLKHDGLPHVVTHAILVKFFVER